MFILFLGPETRWKIDLINFFENDNNIIESHNDILSIKKLKIKKYDFLISYNYKYILEERILNLFKGKAINLHISYLPWNKGSDPNLWSILENTKKGVSIHQMDKNLDTGKLLFQKELFFKEDATLKSSYEYLQDEIVDLFKSKWISIKEHKINPKVQKKGGSYHNSNEKSKFIHLLAKGWDTKVSALEGKALS